MVDVAKKKYFINKTICRITRWCGFRNERNAW